MHRVRVVPALVALAALAALPAPAAADETLAQISRPTPVSAFMGHVVWSEYDAAADAYFLTQRFNGVTARLPVRPRSVPFDVDLGLVSGGVVTAAYSRCRRDPPRRDPRTGNALTQMPQWSRGRGCDLYRLSLGTGAETRIAGAGSRSASEFLPSVWQSRVAFARVYERRRGSAGDRAYLYFHHTRADRTRRVPAGPRGRARYCSGSPPRCRRLTEPGPTTLDLTARYLSFGWDSTDVDGPTSGIYFEKLRAATIRRRRVAEVGSGQIQGRELLGPQPDLRGRLVWIGSLFGDSIRSTIERYNVVNGSRDRAQLYPVMGEPTARVPLASAADNGALFYLSATLGNGAGPGCSDAQLCELRRATGAAFSPARRQPAR